MSPDVVIDRWAAMLQDYHDPLLIEYLKFGFPLSLVSRDNSACKQVVNHATARDYPQAVDEYIQSEISHNALLGPHDDSVPPGFHRSPLLSRPKEGNKRKIIMDL